MVHVAGKRPLQFLCREHPQMRLLLECPASEDACYTMPFVKVRPTRFEPCRFRFVTQVNRVCSKLVRVRFASSTRRGLNGGANLFDFTAVVIRRRSNPSERKLCLLPGFEWRRTANRRWRKGSAPPFKPLPPGHHESSNSRN